MAQMECMPLASEADARSLYAAFQQIEDGRRKRGVCSPLALLLSLMVVAKLAGMNNMNAVVEWVRHRGSGSTKSLGCPMNGGRVFRPTCMRFRKLDAQVVTFILSSALTRLEAERRCADEPSRQVWQTGKQDHQHVAFDGKALRGTYGHENPDHPSVHLCAFYEVKTGIVLAQRTVKDKENEISALKEMFTPALVKGRILSADAMHTQRFFCQQVTHWGGDSLLIAKDNQSNLHENLKLFFEDHAPDVHWETHREVSLQSLCRLLSDRSGQLVVGDQTLDGAVVAKVTMCPPGSFGHAPRMMSGEVPPFPTPRNESCSATQAHHSSLSCFTGSHPPLTPDGQTASATDPRLASCVWPTMAAIRSFSRPFQAGTGWCLPSVSGCSDPGELGKRLDHAGDSAR
jgi:hypothetical protein